MDPYLVYDLIQQYNADPSKYTDEEAETIATLANALGTSFRRESKALSKGLFDFADTASFGLLPNDLRPVSRGESVLGETDSEKMAAALGMLGGAVGSGALIGKGIGMAVKGGRGILSNLKNRTKSGTGGGNRGGNTQNETTNLLELTTGRPRRSELKRNRFPISMTTGQPIPMRGQPMRRLSSSLDDIDLEIKRLDELSAMGDYSAYEALADLEKYRKGFTGKVDYKRRFGINQYDNLDNPYELPF